MTPAVERPRVPADQPGPSAAAFEKLGGICPAHADGNAAAAVAGLVREQFRRFVLDPRYSCLGARAAIRGGSYRMELYAELATSETSDALFRDLTAFVNSLASRENGLTTFVASFLAPCRPDEIGFERLLWAQLQALHDRDSDNPWDPAVSPDPDDDHFSFSLAGRAFFIVGLHAASSRAARQFPWPTLVFNPHDQFDRLRERGHFARMQGLIRAREWALQGSLNPNLGDFGQRSEARQYSGRPVPEDWRCPFRSRPLEQGRVRSGE